MLCAWIHMLRAGRLWGALAATLLVLWANAAAGQFTPDVVRVEEDWELVVGEPDPGNTGPQVTCTISPAGNIETLHAAFSLNQREFPVYSPGGVQLQLWDGETLDWEVSSRTAVLSTQGETVSWTQSMAVAYGVLMFQVSNGSSATWGAFGRNGHLTQWAGTSLTDLNGYRPEVSVQNSGAGFAANRVQSLTLKRVRYFFSTGDVYEDTQARTVYLTN